MVKTCDKILSLTISSIWNMNSNGKTIFTLFQFGDICRFGIWCLKGLMVTWKEIPLTSFILYQFLYRKPLFHILAIKFPIKQKTQHFIIFKNFHLLIISTGPSCQISGLQLDVLYVNIYSYIFRFIKTKVIVETFYLS